MYLSLCGPLSFFYWFLFAAWVVSFAVFIFRQIACNMWAVNIVPNVHVYSLDWYYLYWDYIGHSYDTIFYSGAVHNKLSHVYYTNTLVPFNPFVYHLPSILVHVYQMKNLLLFLTFTHSLIYLLAYLLVLCLFLCASFWRFSLFFFHIISCALLLFDNSFSLS